MLEYQKTFFYIKGFAKGAKLNQTLLALPIAEEAHNGQLRTGGDPFIIHPLRVAASLIALGIEEDELIAAALLHDVFEDTDLTENDLWMKGIHKRPIEIVKAVTKPKDYNAEIYYENISSDVGALLIKIADRCHNCSTMTSFTPARLQKYINETNEYFIPLIHYARQRYPKYEDAFFSLKYQICSLCELAEALLQKQNEIEKP